MEDFQNIEFHQLAELEDETYETPEHAGYEGIKCLQCAERCPGFSPHAWRRGCSNCKCPLWNHDIPQQACGHPFERMNVEEKMAPLNSEYDKALTEGYTWVPRGLRTSQIDVYMRKLSKDEVPKARTDGAKFRARQIVYQLPRQDFNGKHAKFLKEDSQYQFGELRSVCVEEAAGVGGVRASIFMAMNCAGCNSSMVAGDMAVFTDRMGPSKCWHPQCFRCCVDNALLCDMIYFAYDESLYCARHWAEQIKPRCNGCEELIYIGEFTKAMDKSWHIDHFCCWKCDVPLTGKKYIIINEQPFCPGCYNTHLANLCYECEQPIGPESKDLFVKDRHYHKECLLCNVCEKPLDSLSFSFVNNKPVCHPCRGVDPEKSKNCTECAGEFESTEKKVGVSSEYYHERCFVCNNCSRPIGSEQFIKKNDGRRLCNECFEASAKRCTKCNDLIRGSTVKFEGDPFHTECFTCTNCKKQLGGLQFYKNQEDPFCEECYLDNHAKRCVDCYKPIEGNTKFIQYDGKFWHSSCFVCTGCDAGLSGEKFVIREGNRICLRCK